MTTPFIRNHQYNLIKKLVGQLQHACNTVADRKVIEAVRQSTLMKINESFPQATEQQKQMLESVAAMQRTEQFQAYLQELVPYVESFVEATDQQIKKLFPKVKKLKTPNMGTIDRSHMTYLGWTDIASSRMYLVYELGGKLVGVEGRFTPTNKKSVCFVCNRHEEVALFTALTKSKPANASADYYKAIGNYLCASSEACNRNISDTAALERFIQGVVGEERF
ncbi:FusB/FusC family EF-G-binding protein [Paenibacillus sp. YIM B09110]|uniref:FusB/FusC family EF-G-binding protein n=1 Tax=Paenibacillus sp. YIM B09110 TaxID=3126102 RepID=UPI00301E11D6